VTTVARTCIEERDAANPRIAEILEHLALKATSHDVLDAAMERVNEVD